MARAADMDFYQISLIKSGFGNTPVEQDNTPVEQNNIPVEQNNIPQTEEIIL